MERLTDPAQGYCEMYCKKYGHCFGDPGDCIFEKEIAMYSSGVMFPPYRAAGAIEVQPIHSACLKGHQAP